MVDSLSERIESLRRSLSRDRFNREKKDYQSGQAKVRRELTYIWWFWGQVGFSLYWIWIKIIWPAWRKVLRKPLWWLWNFFRWAWDRVAFVKDPYGKSVFSMARGGIFIIAFIFGVWFGLPITVEFTWDAMGNTLLGFHDKLYMNGAVPVPGFQETENVHAFAACWDEWPCTYENSVYFRVRNSYYLDVLYIIKGEGWFFPDHIAAAVPNVPALCDVRGWGIRWRFFMRRFQIYPYIRSISCVPLLDKPQARKE